MTCSKCGLESAVKPPGRDEGGGGDGGDGDAGCVRVRAYSQLLQYSDQLN